MATIEPGEQSRMMIPFSLAAYYFNHFGQPRYPKIATISGPKIASALDRRRAKAIHRKLSQGCRSAIVLRSGLTHAWVDRHRRYPRVSGPLRYRADGCGILQDVSPHQQSLSCRWSVASSTNSAMNSRRRRGKPASRPTGSCLAVSMHPQAIVLDN
jgi:hypothetical protein